MRIATEQDRERVLAYLRPHVQDCLYMYIDIGKYGIEDQFMKVWIAEDDAGDLDCVIMKYHTGMSVFSARDDYPLEEVEELILSEGAKSVTGRKDITDRLHEDLLDRYDYESGYVFRFVKYYPFDIDVEIQRAGVEDMLESAALIAADEEFGSYYDIQDLADQLTERMQTGMGRNYIVRDNGKIVGHIASYAEFDKLATTSGLIVAPEYRSGLMGSFLEKYLVEDLLADGFEVYTFVDKRLRYRLLKSMGNLCVGEYGKLMIKEDC